MFRFTIRDVLWLMVVVAVWLSWWRYHEATTSRLIADAERSVKIAEIRGAGYLIHDAMSWAKKRTRPAEPAP
jgi:hypothetical protein